MCAQHEADDHIQAQDESPPQMKRRVYRPAELIAKFYKYLGLLPRKLNDQNQNNLGGGVNQHLYKSNVKYEPNDFKHNAKVNLGLLNSAKFAEEQLIMFNEKEIQERILNIKQQINQQAETKNIKTKEKIQD